MGFPRLASTVVFLGFASLGCSHAVEDATIRCSSVRYVNKSQAEACQSCCRTELNREDIQGGGTVGLGQCTCSKT